MSNFSCLLLSVAFFSVASPVSGADIETGRNRAAVCTACHGYAGISANDEWPNLAGQKPGYLVKQLKAYRDGMRNDPVMSPMAEGLGDADIDNIAAWFSTLAGH
jgi:cytochrome c553